jgi:opacity protein-like surface antigen
MRRIVLAAAAVTLAAGLAAAADLPRLLPLRSAAPVLWNWTGLYWGAHLGGSFGSSSFSDPAGPGIYGGSVPSPAALAGIQLGYNFQPSTNWLVGVEADLSALNANGSNTCMASSGNFLSANCRVRQNAMSSGTGRIGFVTGPGGRTLLYAKAGAAWLGEKIDIASNPLIFASSANDGRFGWTAGAGVEQAMAPAWSVKIEYDYAEFGSKMMPTPQSGLQVAYPSTYVLTPQGTSKVSQDIHSLKVGLNIKLGGDAVARFDDSYSLRGSLRGEQAPPVADAEIGARVWYSFGRFQKDLGATTDQGSQNVLVSRLTYEAQAASGELFGRIDGPYDLFLKGFGGGGGLRNGRMHDEDWLICLDQRCAGSIPYSNTLSDPVKSSIAYTTIDAGYDLLRGATYKFGGFVGYNYYRENKSAYGCVQIANQNAGCVPAIAKTVLGITQDNTWHSVRVGFNSEIGLGHGLKLSADAAYLPFVKMFGTDNHVLRTDVTDTVSPEQGAGQGVQLEAILSYRMNNAFSIGAGARYWAMWTTTNAHTNIFGSECPCQTLPAHTERYGTFLQAAYKFDALR